jgi:N-acetylglucosaminyldiphosphoundecaprenol N-acetyl-beta-D-mannosaminyltransferase
VWDEAVSVRLVDGVTRSGAQALWLGVSAPKQENWAVAHAELLGMPIACVGAAFDFVAGAQPRAPRWVRAMRMEWLFRLMSEPKRLWRRYLVGNTLFIWDALRFRDRPASKSPRA